MRNYGLSLLAVSLCQPPFIYPVWSWGYTSVNWASKEKSVCWRPNTIDYLGYMDRYYITVAISGTISRMNKVAQESHFQHCFPVLNQDVLFLSGFFFFFFLAWFKISPRIISNNTKETDFYATVNFTSKNSPMVRSRGLSKIFSRYQIVFYNMLLSVPTVLSKVPKYLLTSSIVVRLYSLVIGVNEKIQFTLRYFLKFFF